MVKQRITAPIAAALVGGAAAAFIGCAVPAHADLVRHHDGARQIQEHAPIGTEAAAFGHGR